MPDTDSNPAAAVPEVKVRELNGQSDRRQHNRRQFSRFGDDRRRGDRRRKTLRTLLLAAAAVSAAPTAVKTQPQSFAALQPHVSVSMGNVVPLEVPTGERAFAGLIAEAASAYGVDAALIRAVMKTESAFDPSAVSPVGAMGLMQLMPDLAKEMGVTDPFDPRENVMAGAKYLSRLLESHRGNVALTLASYNAGPGNVKKYKGIPPFTETRNYVKKITDILGETSD